MNDSTLLYDRPAREWLEALPIGNGALGAMCYGGEDSARFDLNEQSAWSGSPQNEVAQPRATADVAAAALAEARQAISEGRVREATAALQRMQSSYSQAYLPVGTLVIEMPGVPTVSQARDEGDETRPASSDRYRRELDLATGVHTVTSTRGFRSVRQRTLVSAPHGVFMHIIEGFSGEVHASIHTRHIAVATMDDGLRHTAVVRLPSDVPPTHEPSFAAASGSDVPGRSVHAAIVTQIVHIPSGDEATRAVVFAAIETDFVGLGQFPDGDWQGAVARASERLDRAIADGPDRVFVDHCADFRRLSSRVTLSLGDGKDDDIPTDERLGRAMNSGRRVAQTDPGLVSILFDYGRYLLISSSRAGGLPATLQGIWNESMQPPWSSSYTLNINLQMNYWQADVANLSELAQPLIDFIEALACAGTETAKRLYGTRGWVAHHNSDAWLYTSPVGNGSGDPSWAFWPMAGPWLVRHLWEHYAFGSASESYLSEKAWPIIRSAAEFGLDWMVRLDDGTWGTQPSSSPETGFVDSKGNVGSVATSSTLDITLLRELFEIVAEVAAICDLTEDVVVRESAERLKQLPEVPLLASDGMVAEWSGGLQSADAHHRHVSPLYRIYPGSGEVTSDARRGAIALLERRGDDSTGWSLAWKLALWARLGRADRVDDLLALVMRPAGGNEPHSGGLYPNFFAAHPPFQIDGNLGFVAVLAECLLQSHDQVITLLPALPLSLDTGSITGIVARPGIIVSLSWEQGRLCQAELVARQPRLAGMYDVRYRGTTVSLSISADAACSVSARDFEERSLP